MKLITAIAILALTGCGGAPPADRANVVITQPAAGARIAGDFMVTFTYDESRIHADYSRLLLDGREIANTTYRQPDLDCVLWKSTAAQNGTHRLELVIYDTDWHAHHSAEQLVTVAN